jgi:hypothetical protein
LNYKFNTKQMKTAFDNKGGFLYYSKVLG